MGRIQWFVVIPDCSCDKLPVPLGTLSPGARPPPKPHAWPPRRPPPLWRRKRCQRRATAWVRSPPPSPPSPTPPSPTPPNQTPPNQTQDRSIRCRRWATDTDDYYIKMIKENDSLGTYDTDVCIYKNHDNIYCLSFFWQISLLYVSLDKSVC